MALVNVDKYSAAGAQAVRNAVKQRDDQHRPEPTEAEADAIAAEADFKNCYGFDARRDKNGNPIEQGVGAYPHRVTMNSIAAVRKYEGEQSYIRFVQRLWKDAPDRCQQLGLPKINP